MKLSARLGLLFLIVFLCAGKVNAQEHEPIFFGGLNGFLLAQALAAGMSGLATSDPVGFGVATALWFPMTMVYDKLHSDKTTMSWSELAAIESLAVYNIVALDKEDTNKKIFLNNMIAWNVLFTTDMFFLRKFDKDKTDQQNSVSFQYQPLKEGVLLKVRYEF